MVTFKELEEDHKTFREEFVDIVYNFNKKNKDSLTFDKIEEKFRKSGYYNKLKEYLKERDWKIVSEGWDIEVEKTLKNGEIRLGGIPVLIQRENGELMIETWSMVWGRIEHLFKSTNSKI